MNIIITYTLQYRSLDIYVSGCNPPHCIGCHNLELWDFNIGKPYNFNLIKEYIEDFNMLIDKIMIFGGEPLDQNYDELITMLKDLQQFNKEIWLFTKYNIDEVPFEILKLCDYIKCGRYIKELVCDDNQQYGINLATSNQIIYKIEKGV